MGTRKLKSVSKPGIKEVWSMYSFTIHTLYQKRSLKAVLCRWYLTLPESKQNCCPLLKHFLICEQHEQVIWRLLICELLAAVNPVSSWMPRLPCQRWIRDPHRTPGDSASQRHHLETPCCPGLFTACNSHQPSWATVLLRDKTGQHHALIAPPGQPFCRPELNPS